MGGSAARGEFIKVLFPPRTELLRSTFFNADLKNGMVLKFEEFQGDEEYFGHVLPTV